MAHFTDATPGRIVLLNGKAYRYFGGTSYLGLQSNPEFKEMLAENVRKYGSSHGASRLSNLRLEVYARAEEYMAEWCGSPAALLMSSGFLAGQMLAQFFEGNGYQAFYAPHAHAALFRGGHLPYNSYPALAEAIAKHLDSHSGRPPVLFMDSTDLSGKGYPGFSGLKHLPLRELILVADDSHGLGILGEDGGGAYRKLLGLTPKELLVCGSLGKAMGLQAGLILCSRERRADLWETPFFAGASPPSPAHMATLLQARPLYMRQWQRLTKNIMTFESAWQNRKGFTYTCGYPVYAFKNPSLTRKLEAGGVMVTDFPYPSTGADSLPGRIILSAHHDHDDIALLAALLNEPA